METVNFKSKDGLSSTSVRQGDRTTIDWGCEHY
jgi:hypothetical protein